jgi:PhnB protein
MPNISDQEETTMKLNPYLNFQGDCREALEAYAQILGGRLGDVMTFAGTPAEEHVPAEWRGKVMHATLDLGDGVLMASDVPPGMCSGGGQGPGGGTHVALHPASVAEGSRIFDALAEGGQVVMPFTETFWAAGFGHVIDRWGTNWMVNVERDAAASSAA